MPNQAYHPAHAEQVKLLCKLGAAEAELAEFFHVSPQTLSTWRTDHPAFAEAMQEGTTLADAQVAERLFLRACGYSHTETDVRVIQGELVQTEITKHYPPDTVAAIFWLKNRQPGKWRAQPVPFDEEGRLPARVQVQVNDATARAQP